MKKLLLLTFLSVALSGCSLPWVKSSVLQETLTPQDGDTVTVHYVGTHDDGTEFDSSRKEGRSPLEFIIGRGSMIKGFEDAVRTMKVGEKKTVRLEPKDAYGEEYIEQTIPLESYKEVVTQTVPVDALVGTLEQKLPLDQAKQLFGGTLEVGTEKAIGEASLKILSVSGEDIVVSIVDPKAPFYGKKIAVGMTTTAQDGSELTVKSIDGKSANIDIKIKQEVVSKTDREVTLKVKNPHPLAGKPLNFEIELLSIKKVQESAQEAKSE